MKSQIEYLETLDALTSTCHEFHPKMGYDTEEDNTKEKSNFLFWPNQCLGNVFLGLFFSSSSSLELDNIQNKDIDNKNSRLIKMHP